MKASASSARTFQTSGRFACRSHAWIVCAALVVAGCATAGGGGGGGNGDARGNATPVLSDAPISPEREAEAARMMSAAEAAFAADRLDEVLDLTAQIILSYPSASVSGRALLLNARAALALGMLVEADAAAERYIELLPRDDPRGGEVRLLQARALAGNPEARLGRLIQMSAAAAPDEVERAVPLARAAADSLDAAQLDSLLAEAPADGPLVPAVRARFSGALLEAGDSIRAADVARSALAAGVQGPDSTIAAGVLRGEMPPGRGRVTSFEIATILPLGGSPALADFARSVAEGVEVAAATVLDPPFEVTVTSLDDQGDPELGARLLAELEQEPDRVAGVVGFLEDYSLEVAGLARQIGLPVISPTARTAARAGEGVFSLQGPDPRAASMMARYAAAQGYARVAIVHSSAPQSSEEADAFQTAADSLGVPVVGRYAYPADDMFFESEILAARDALRAAEIEALGLTEDDTLHVELLEPVAVFLPLPPEDVEFVAPQITHFGLDTLGIEILGTSGWTDPQTLATVDPRHTNGVVATAPSGTGPASAGYLRFKEAYEEHFQRTLVSPVPAVGYDATLLLLDALRQGRVAPPDVTGALRSLERVEGATGIFSVTGGRVIRETEIVRIEGGRPVPMG